MEEPKKLLNQLPADFFKQLKDSGSFQSFMAALFKRGVEQCWKQNGTNIQAMKDMAAWIGKYAYAH